LASIFIRMSPLIICMMNAQRQQQKRGRDPYWPQPHRHSTKDKNVSQKSEVQKSVTCVDTSIRAHKMLSSKRELPRIDPNGQVSNVSSTTDETSCADLREMSSSSCDDGDSFSL